MLETGKSPEKRRFELEKITIDEFVSDTGQISDAIPRTEWTSAVFGDDALFALLHVADEVDSKSLSRMLLTFNFANVEVAFLGEYGRYLIRQLTGSTAVELIERCMALLINMRRGDAVYLGLVDSDGSKYLLSRRPWASNRVIRGIIASYSGEHFFQLEVMFRSR
jgi:hypothetical protein